MMWFSEHIHLHFSGNSNNNMELRTFKISYNYLSHYIIAYTCTGAICVQGLSVKKTIGSFLVC